jgi:hypothetical protein
MAWWDTIATNVTNWWDELTKPKTATKTAKPATTASIPFDYSKATYMPATAGALAPYKQGAIPTTQTSYTAIPKKATTQKAPVQPSLAVSLAGLLDPEGQSPWYKGLVNVQNTMGDIFNPGWQDQQYLTGYGPMVGLAGSGLGGIVAESEAAAKAGQLGLAGTGATVAKTAPKIPQWLGALGGLIKKHPLAATLGAAGGGYMGYANRPGQESPFPPGMTEAPGFQALWPGWTPDYKTSSKFGGAPTTQPSAQAPAPVLPEPGMGGLGGEPEEPRVVDVGGQQFWYDPGTGTWNLLPQQKAAANTDQDWWYQQNINRENNAASLEQIRLQNELARQREAASATENMATMYAQDPYKYWAQMGQLTPEAVARLTGGQVQAGQPFQGTPLSYPSMQWWNNLLPSEQEQILGVLNWMGINPEDWFAMQQRMMPGLSSRQMEPVWAR